MREGGKGAYTKRGTDPASFMREGGREGSLYKAWN